MTVEGVRELGRVGLYPRVGCLPGFLLAATGAIGANCLDGTRTRIGRIRGCERRRAVRKSARKRRPAIVAVGVKRDGVSRTDLDCNRTTAVSAGYPIEHGITISFLCFRIFNPRLNALKCRQSRRMDTRAFGQRDKEPLKKSRNIRLLLTGDDL